eukprot:TRINITY_DN9478_c1_g1_i1.p1 TRINITY_DN9478_c1_g1~~TRINITY_DN9478_c1_g1_i1.p1  ORF type:complete len:111 (-),score=14.51 TRINITY_DN9478_c1_g1_i1:28-339(-)
MANDSSSSFSASSTLPSLSSDSPITLCTIGPAEDAMSDWLKFFATAIASAHCFLSLRDPSFWRSASSDPDAPFPLEKPILSQSRLITCLESKTVWMVQEVYGT